MEVFRFFENKMVSSGLADSENLPLMGFLNAEKSWNQKKKSSELFSKIIDNHKINSILYFEPAEPYKSIINYLAKNSNGCIYPQDCETRTFLHDLPVIDRLEFNSVSNVLKKRKGVIIQNNGIVTTGSISMEQAFVSASSICFASYVKFFTDYLKAFRQNNIPEEFRKIFNRLRSEEEKELCADIDLAKNIFTSEEVLLSAINKAGIATVDYRLVDSYFGNISALYNDTLYISQTGSSLDNLQDHIDPCKIDGSSCSGITASSELPTHMQTIRKTNARTILHGHPKFSVILSMDCTEKNCPENVECHLNCTVKRDICGVPVVPGEVGTGKYGLCNTVPAALINNDRVIVYGHGVFTIGTKDFNSPFARLLETENLCKKEYFKRVDGLS